MTRLDAWKRVCTIFLICGATAIASPAQPTFTTLLSFDGSNGASPSLMSLVQGLDGDLYGTTFAGGAKSYGTVFKIAPSGKLTTLYSFCPQFNCVDGVNPVAGLVQAANGNFYGTASAGGARNFGTVFSISPSGTLTTLHSFCTQTNCPDGANPQGGLVQATDGNFYGTTATGGGKGYGTVFRITPRGKLKTLHSFCAQTNCPDGATPQGGLVQASDGNFYGTTNSGGASGNCNSGCGTVFRITPGGALTTLHRFDGADGSNPEGGLVQASDGNFYGTTNSGGSSNFGTVFKVDVGLGAFVETSPYSGKMGRTSLLDTVPTLR